LSPKHRASRKFAAGARRVQTFRFETSGADVPRTVAGFCAHLVTTNRRSRLQKPKGPTGKEGNGTLSAVSVKEVLPLRWRAGAFFTGFPVFCIPAVFSRYTHTHTRARARAISRTLRARAHVRRHEYNKLLSVTLRSSADSLTNQRCIVHSLYSQRNNYP